MSTPSFRERFGLPEKDLQINSIDSRTRRRLWNEINVNLFPYIIDESSYRIPKSGLTFNYIYALWSDVIGWSITQLPEQRYALIDSFEKYLLNDKLPWFKFLEFIEKALTCNLEVIYGTEDKVDDFINNEYVKRVNKVFTEEACGFRFLGQYLTPITDTTEINEINEAINNQNSVSFVKDHIKNALKHLSNREKPDYNNSVKESIFALEALFKLIAEKPDATLSSVLGHVSKRVKIHSKLQLSIKEMYDWSSDASGIRHANKSNDGGETFDTAKFILVWSSGLTNYLITKCQEEGISLKV